MIAIIDYNAGNVASVKNGLSRLGVDCIITSEPAIILSAQGVIFPGQGRAGTAMKELQKSGIDKTIAEISRPFWVFALVCSCFRNFLKKTAQSAFLLLKENV